jgi:hypothetical protein
VAELTYRGALAGTVAFGLVRSPHGTDNQAPPLESARNYPFAANERGESGGLRLLGWDTSPAGLGATRVAGLGRRHA